MTLRNVWLCVAAFSSVSLFAGDYSNGAFSLVLPSKWGVDPAKLEGDNSDVIRFGPTGATSEDTYAEDYPSARAWVLQKGIKSTDPDLARRLDFRTAKNRVVLLDRKLQVGGRPARRMDFFTKAGGDTYFHSTLVIDPGDGAASIALDIFFYDTTLTSTSDSNTDIRRDRIGRTQYILMAMDDVQTLLTSFKPAKVKSAR